MRAMAFLAVAVTLGAGIGVGETPHYLWGEIRVPEGAVQTLSVRAGALGIPTAVWTEAGLTVAGAADEAAMLAEGAYLYVDGPCFLLAVDSTGERAVLRGTAAQAELIVGGTGDVLYSPPSAFLALAGELGLLPTCSVELQVKEVPLKLPRPPEGMKLDPVLWALVGHPDWLGFARDYALDRVGIRVRVVAQVAGALAAEFEPYIQSSSGALVELLIPIPLLPDLGRDPAVEIVRPPYVPHPAGG
ncbi:MAG: hypothetical protein NUV94_05625 [Candidatus Acetothermia bacterium]|jgi:hypothetical protein|nr:hypothetical protein [Candidatus Acetothermia bacterium]